MGELYDDVYFGDINQRYEDLAQLSPEGWSAKGKSDNAILKNYLKYTYKKLEEEGKILRNSTYSIFNTGLFTEYYEPIFAYLVPNGAGGAQPLYLKDFVTPYDLGNLGIAEHPERANYFEQPELLVFDVKCKINVQYKHILSDSA